MGSAKAQTHRSEEPENPAIDPNTDFCKYNSIEERQSFQQITLEQLDIHVQEREGGRKGPRRYIKINSREIINLNIKCKLKNS